MDAIVSVNPPEPTRRDPLVDALKEKVINEFSLFVHKLNQGYFPNYEFILEEILFLELIEKDATDNDSSVLQYYLNNEWIV